MIHVILLGSIFFSVITAYLLFFKTYGYQKFSSQILAFFLICYALCTLAYLLIVSGWIIEIPHFYKIAAPVNYLIPPLGYLYVRSVLRNENAFYKMDYWHLLPFILFAINYLPLYTMDIDQKRDLVNSLLNDNSINYSSQDGFMSEYVHLIARMIQSPIYLYFQWKLIIDFKQKSMFSKYEYHTKYILRWLRIFNWITSLVLISILCVYLVVLINPELVNSKAVMLFPSLGISIGYLVLSSFLLLNPEVLFGLPYAIRTSEKLSQENLNKKKISSLATIKDYETEIDQLKQYFIKEKPFLIKTININEIAIALNIPARDFSFIINQLFNKRFTDFINEYRIEYVIQKIEGGYCDKFTIESLSTESGFSTKSTFNIAFKKYKNCTPSEFITNTKPTISQSISD